MKKKKIRLDLHLSTTGFSSSRESAKREILSGWVKVNGETVRTPSKMITGNEKIIISRPKGIFVSRGGEKLQKALNKFNISLKEKNTVDLGASTGGFTDCMLKAGAAIVYAVDVGYGQFDYTLRNDNRIVLKERTNVKNLKKDDFNDNIDFVAADLSFISILKVYNIINELFKNADGIILIKPQFESAKAEQSKGVVKKIENHLAIITRVIHKMIDMGMIFIDLTYSPIKGPAGNIEFLLYFKNCNNNAVEYNPDEIDIKINEIVKEAHENLKRAL